MLLVDIGNTRVKWATYVDGVVAGQQAAAHAQWSIAEWSKNLFDAQPVQQVLAASVAGAAQRSKLQLAATTAGATIKFVAVAAQAGGVRNSYPDPSLLGVDRWVAAIGAYRRYGTACCVVDVGTAATIDAVDDRGTHLGGFIVPGPELMVRSLLQGTSDLASHASRSKPEAQLSFANNTREAIERGCRVALAALIDRSQNELRARVGSTP